ncbi:MAG: hypothetical protein AB7I18_15035 [Candidatus Berkiella sp.]
MRQLSSQEINFISGGVAGAASTSVDGVAQDAIKWVTGALGGFFGTSANTLYSYPLFGVDVAKYGLGGVGCIVGAAAGYFLGKLLSDNVVKPYA